MTTLTETAHTAEFILSEANGQRSRENGVVASGQTLKAGQLVKANGNYLVAYTDGSTPLGVLLNAVDASAAAVPAAYLARDAEVNGGLLTYPSENSAGTVKSTAKTALKALGIICR